MFIKMAKLAIQITIFWIHFHRIQMSCKETGQGRGRYSDRPCFANDIHFSIICVAEEPGDKFRVQQTVDG